MSGVRAFFRFCPSCGRRFEIRLVSKKPIGSEGFTGKEEEVFVEPRFPLVLEQDAPVVVDIEEFQYTYKCKHCGHTWSEVHEKRKEGPAPRGFTGD